MNKQKILNCGIYAAKSRHAFSRWLSAAALVAILTMASPTTFGFVQYLRPATYLAERAAEPATSPFRPFLEADPQPMLDFQPWSPPAKPQIRNPGDIASWGYIIWQKSAYLEKYRECFDPFTEAYVGWRDYLWEWDVNLGHRLQIWDELYGIPSYTNSGWMWSGSAAWSHLDEGTTWQVRPWYFIDANGFKCYGVEESDSEWMLRNLSASSGPKFEVAVGWDLKCWPYSWYLADAYSAGTVTQYGTWRIIACARGATIDITPRNYEVPMNHRLTAYPYLISAWRNLASNNSQLPEWVEGWE